MVKLFKQSLGCSALCVCYMFSHSNNTAGEIILVKSYLRLFGSQGKKVKAVFNVTAYMTHHSMQKVKHGLGFAFSCHQVAQSFFRNLQCTEL